MNIKEVPKHLGITASRLAELINISKQQFNNYSSGRAGASANKVEKEICINTGILFERIFFKDAFETWESANKSHPSYWISLALEALNEAQKRGVDLNRVEEAVYNLGKGSLPDPIYAEELF